MAYTIQHIIDTARVSLGDAIKARWADETLVRFAEQALLITRRRRPDLFVGAWTLATPYKLTDVLPCSDTFLVVLADYVVACAENIGDNPPATEGRAAHFYALFEKGMGQ